MDPLFRALSKGKSEGSYWPVNDDCLAVQYGIDKYDRQDEHVQGTLPLSDWLTVYSIAGTENYTSDGTVPYNSVNYGKYIFQDQVKHFTEITVTGANTAHSDLPQNKQIVSLIRQYLLAETMPDKVRQKNAQRVQN